MPIPDVYGTRLSHMSKLFTFPALDVQGPPETTPAKVSGEFASTSRLRPCVIFQDSEQLGFRSSLDYFKNFGGSHSDRHYPRH